MSNGDSKRCPHCGRVLNPGHFGDGSPNHYALPDSTTKEDAERLRARAVNYAVFLAEMAKQMRADGYTATADMLDNFRKANGDG